MLFILDKKIILIEKQFSDWKFLAEPLKSIIVAAKHKVAQLAFNLQQP